MAEKYDIFIQAGQSNAEGMGGGAVTEEYIPDDRICYLEAEKTVTITDSGLDIQYHDVPFSLKVAAEHGTAEDPTGDFSLTFARAYIDAGLLTPDRKILIIRAAVGGTGFQKKQAMSANPIQTATDPLFYRKRIQILWNRFTPYPSMRPLRLPQRIMPSDTRPASFAGLRLVMTMTFLPTISSGV